MSQSIIIYCMIKSSTLVHSQLFTSSHAGIITGCFVQIFHNEIGAFQKLIGGL